MTFEGARRNVEAAINRIIREINALESKYNAELIRIAQKRQLLYEVENRLSQLKPIMVEYSTLRTFPFIGAAQRLQELQRHVAEYNKLMAKAESIRREILREESALLTLRNRISRLQSMMMTYERMRAAVPEEKTPMPAETMMLEQMQRREMRRIKPLMQLEQELLKQIAEVQKKLTEAYAKGDRKEIRKYEAQLSRLQSQLRKLRGGMII